MSTQTPPTPKSPQSSGTFPAIASASTTAAAKKSPAAAWKSLVAWLQRLVNGPSDPPGAPFAAARRRLILTTISVVAIVLAVLTIAVFILNQRTEQDQTIGLLKYYALAGSAAVRDNDGKPPASDGDAPLVPYSPNSADTFIVVLNPQGQTISDPDQIEHLGVPVVASAQQVLKGQYAETSPTVAANGHNYQLYITSVVHNGQMVAVVVTGTSLERQQHQENEFIRALAVIYGVALLLTFFSTVFLTERALRPARLAFIRQRQFATAASHELKTPLAVIRSEAELASGLLGDGLAVLRETQPNQASAEQVSGYLEEALHETQAATSEVDYMTRMVQGMLMLARDSSDSLAHAWSDIDLHTLLDDITDRIRPLAERDGLRIESPTAAAQAGERPVALVRGDADLLRQLFFGLLENAMRYTPAGGTIRVDVRLEKRAHLLGDHRRHAYVSISDTGVGIAPEHLANIFEPFYRVVSAARPLRSGQHGTGLGLALAQWVVLAHGGEIEVQSTVGVGTVFTIALPLVHG